MAICQHILFINISLCRDSRLQRGVTPATHRSLKRRKQMAEPQKQLTVDAAETAINQRIAQMAKATGVPEEQIRRQMGAAQREAQRDPLTPSLMGMAVALVGNFNAMALLLFSKAADRASGPAKIRRAGLPEDQRRTVPLPVDLKILFDANATAVTALCYGVYRSKVKQRAAAEIAAKQSRPAHANSNNPQHGPLSLKSSGAEKQFC